MIHFIILYMNQEQMTREIRQSEPADSELEELKHIFRTKFAVI